MSNVKDCSYFAYRRGECGYDEYLERAYNAKGQLTTHFTDRVDSRHPFFIIKKISVNYDGVATLTFSVFDELRGLIVKFSEPLPETDPTPEELWNRVSNTVMELKDYFTYLNDIRG